MPIERLDFRRGPEAIGVATPQFLELSVQVLTLAQQVAAVVEPVAAAQREETQPTEGETDAEADQGAVVRADQPERASVADAAEKLRYDLYYVKHMSPLFDLNIILRTVGVILFGKGAR